MATKGYDLEQTGEQVQNALNEIINLAPATEEKDGLMSSSDKASLEHLNETIETKVDKVTGKGLSTNDYDNTEKAKVASSYQKPGTGIPKSDLSEDVKESLGKADTSSQDVTEIKAKIPAQASAQNQLADKAFVNSSIATAAAEFKGTYESLAGLQAVTADKNDYGYVVSTDQAGNTVYSRYKYNGSAWVFEYELNNSSFTAAEWASIQSQITAALVQKLSALPTNQQLTQSLNGKQDNIQDLSAIRSGAAAGATAYQKPLNGIPASDLAEGVIPTVPTISTNISADAASDVKTASPKAVKNYVDTGIADVESDLSDLADEVDAIDIGAYEVAWDGSSAPVVANIPDGVVITYGGTNYTGTLAASASTKQKIYLVATETSGNYDRYVTVGDSTYSWVNIGTTEITLAGYSTKAEVSQLEAKVGDTAEAFQALPLNLTLGYFDVTGASVASTATSSTQTSYVEIPAKSGDKFKVYGYSPQTPGRLWCFMDASRNVLSIADEDVAARTNPAQLTAPSGAATLLVQFLRYDESTDKVEKYMSVPISDTLDGTTETDWSATNQSLTAGKYYNTNSSTMPTGTSSSTGTYCAKIAVTPGEIYRITGVGGGASVRLYATAGSDYARKRYSGSNVARRDCPEMVTIASDEAYLYVNLYTYDSTTDKIEKLTSSSSHDKGLIERVADLENNPVTTPIVDALNSTSTNDALSANQGRVLNEDINGITSETTEAMAIRDSKYFNTENSRVPSPDNLADTTNGSCVYLFVNPGEVYRIYGNGNSGSWQLYAMADADRYVVQNGTPGVSMNTRTTPLDLTIPEGVAILVVNLYQYDSQTDKVLKVGHTTTDCVKTRLTALEDNDNLELPLKGKKIMFFGDSITDLTYNGKGLTSYFAQASLATCYKAAIGGTRFVQRTTPVDTPTTSTEAYAALDICNMVKAWCDADYTKQDAATTYLNDHSARVTALKNNPIAGVDIVCIGGGTNDMTGNSPIGNDSDNTFDTIKGAINKMVELLLTANPKLKIYFYSPVVGYHGAGGRTDANWDDNHQFSSGKTKPEYIDIFAERARKNHIPYINLYWTLGWNQTNFSQYFLDTDDHHPYKGFDVIGRRLYQQVVTNLE